MNEKIKELAEQADLYARSDNSSMLFENYQKRYTEKFAELILEQILDYIDTMEKIAHATNASIPAGWDEYTYLETLNCATSFIKKNLQTITSY
jgi:hypothetical protein